MPALDLEWGNEMSTAQLTAWVHEFMNTYKSQTGITPILYASPSYVQHELDSSINKYDLWIAHWGVSQPQVNRKWSFWQYTDSGRVNGIGGRTCVVGVCGGQLEFSAVSVGAVSIQHLKALAFGGQGQADLRLAFQIDKNGVAAGAGHIGCLGVLNADYIEIVVLAGQFGSIVELDCRCYADNHSQY